MDKVAQKRRWYNKVREKLNQPEETLIGKFSPEFVELMDKLREVDDTVREQAMELKGLLKLAKTNFSRLEYMSAIAYLGRFHEKMEAINYELSKLGTTVDIKHHEFLFGDMDQEDIDFLVKKLQPKLKKKTIFKSILDKAPSKNIKTKASLESAAGLQDWWAANFGPRRKALSAWEKRFPKKSKELNRQTHNLITKSEQIFSFLLSTLNELNSYRNTRRLEEYLSTADKFKQKYAIYNELFTAFYNTYIRELVELQQQKMEENPVDLDLFNNENPEVELGAPTDKTVSPMAKSMPASPAAIPQAAPVAEPKDFLIQPKAREWPTPVPAATRGQIPDHLKEWMAAEKNKRKQADEMFPITEHDVGSTLRSPVPAQPASTEQTISEPVFNLSHVPDERENTLVSPQPVTQHRDRPIDVSVVQSPSPVTEPSPPPQTPATRRSASSSPEEFLAKLTKLADGNQFKMALEILAYAKTVNDVDIERQLMQLANNLISK